MRLLIADDSEVLRSRLVEVLSEIEGIEIIGQVETAVEVRTAAVKLKPDVVILDIRMPEVNGIVALENIKREQKSPIVIIFTNYPYLQYRKKCIDAGADFFFYKANEFDSLIGVLRKLAKEPFSKPK